MPRHCNGIIVGLPRRYLTRIHAARLINVKVGSSPTGEPVDSAMKTKKPQLRNQMAKKKLNRDGNAPSDWSRGLSCDITTHAASPHISRPSLHLTASSRTLTVFFSYTHCSPSLFSSRSLTWQPSKQRKQLTWPPSETGSVVTKEPPSQGPGTAYPRGRRRSPTGNHAQSVIRHNQILLFVGP